MNELAWTLTQKPINELTRAQVDYLLSNWEEYLDYSYFRELSDYRDHLDSM